MASGENTNDIRKDLDQLREDFQALRDDLSKATGNLVDRGRDSVHAARQQARDTTDEAIDELRRNVNDRPLTSLVAALGIGVLLGVMFPRS